MTTIYYQLKGKILDADIHEHYWQYKNAANRAISIAKSANSFYSYAIYDDPANERFAFVSMTDKQLDFRPSRLAAVQDNANECFDVLEITKVEVDIFDEPSDEEAGTLALTDAGNAEIAGGAA